MPIRPVTDPSVLSQLNAGGNMVASNPLFPAQSREAVAKADAAEATAPYAGTKANADARKAEADARIAAANAAIAAAKNDTDLKVAQANLAKAQLEAKQLQAAKGGAMDALQAQLDRVGELFRQDVQGGLPNPIFGHLPLPSYQQFDSAAQGLVNPFQSAFRVPGVGSQSDRELAQFLQSNVPSATDSDAVIQEKIRNLQTRVDTERKSMGQPTASSQLPPITGDNPDQAGFATEKARSYIDPALRATGQRVGRMIADGVADDKILSFLKKSGVDPSETNVQQALQFRRSSDFKAWQRANPGKAYPLGSDFYTKQVPMTGVRSLVNKAAANDLGGAAMAAGVGAANALTGDRLASAVGALSGEPGTAQTGMELLSTNHPVADLAGNVAGQATLEAAAGLVPGAQGLMATRYGRRGADALYGAYYGSGDDSGGDALTGGAGGGALNAGGGMIGRGLQRAIGKTMTGVTDPALKYLNDAQVPVTVGQIGRGAESTFGHAIGGIEDRAAGLPIFDAIINSARRRGEEGFNSAAFREMGGSGSTGAQGVAEGRNLVDNAYSFLGPLKIPLDAQFAGSQAAVRAGLPDLPKYGPEIATSLNVMDKSAKGGSLAGRDWQSALRAVKGDRASLRGKEFSQGAIDTLGDVENNLMDLAARQAPPDVQGSLAAANNLNKKFNTITAALDNGPTQARGELFSASRLNTASLANARNFGGRTNAVAGNRPFYDLTKAGMDVMPNQVPDSGTAGRALLYSTLFGSGVGGGLGAAFSPDDRSGGAEEGGKIGLSVPFAIAALYSKTGQKAIQRALLGDRSDRTIKIGNFLINRSKLAGLLGSGLAREEVYQPGLPQ